MRPRPALEADAEKVRMQYISTRGGIEPVGFSDAVLMGLASDGGLLLPESIPDVSTKLDEWRGLSYPELAYEIISLYSDVPDDDLRDIIKRSYEAFDHEDVTPSINLGDVHILELFHGPTLSFKDVALQFLGHMFEYILERRNDDLNIVGATSGDTGSAAIYGVKGSERINIFIMHPDGRTSRTQELQMTTVPDENVFNIAVDGDFDDCQRVLKSIFNDLDFKSTYSLGSINSINWARLVAQIVYYFFSAFRVMDSCGSQRVSFTVPTGNFGDIFAGYIAAQMGLPVEKLVLATNENDILARFFNSGVYSLGDVHPTISPSMDIQVASNFERYLFFRAGKDPKKLSSMMSEFQEKGSLAVDLEKGGSVDALISAGSADTSDTLEAIRECYREHGYLLDPHTAVGVHVAAQQGGTDVPMVCLATAHPAKFSQAIIDAVGEDIAHHPSIDGLEGMQQRCRKLPADPAAVKKYIQEVCG